jgi:hypothetical protein
MTRGGSPPRARSCELPDLGRSLDYRQPSYRLKVSLEEGAVKRSVVAFPCRPRVGGSRPAGRAASGGVSPKWEMNIRMGSKLSQSRRSRRIEFRPPSRRRSGSNGPTSTVAGRLQVKRSLQRLRGRGLVFVEPKSYRSRRMVCLSSPGVAALREQRIRVSAEMVFPNLCCEPQDASSVTDALTGRAGSRRPATDSCPRPSPHHGQHLAGGGCSSQAGPRPTWTRHGSPDFDHRGGLSSGSAVFQTPVPAFVKPRAIA